MNNRKIGSYGSPVYRSDVAGNTALASSDRAPSSEQRGWDAYRKWLSRVNANPVKERVPLDRSIYSWKGYNVWANRVKQSWKPEDS